MKPTEAEIEKSFELAQRIGSCLDPLKAEYSFKEISQGLAMFLANWNMCQREPWSVYSDWHEIVGQYMYELKKEMENPLTRNPCTP